LHDRRERPSHAKRQVAGFREKEIKRQSC
jgi:hypothetical protein